MKFKLHDIRESKVWQEAHEGGIEVGDARRSKKTIDTLIAKGMTPVEIARLFDMATQEVLRVAEGDSH